MNPTVQQTAYGLCALAGAASNNVKQRIELQAYLDSGDADDALELMGSTREDFYK